MAMSPKAFAAFLSIGGSCVGVPLILWKEGQLGVAVSSQETSPAPSPATSVAPTTSALSVIPEVSSDSTTSLSSPRSTASPTENRPVVARKLSNIQNPSTQRGNCDVLNLEKDYEDFLIGQKKNEVYVELSCENTNEGTGQGSLPHNWTGLFPEALFYNGESFKVGQKFNLKTVTQEVDGKTKTTFKSGALRSPYVGTWGKTLKTNKEEAVSSITLDSSSDKSNVIYWIAA